MTLSRRHALLIAAALPWAVRAEDDAVGALRAGGCVVALRHALAPGTFDPPEFRLGDCRTQRNLSDEGRAQARRIGDWFRSRGLQPAAVRSSPWCRCEETARLAFGEAAIWRYLGSPRGSAADVNAGRIPAMRAGLAAVPAGRFEVWVTHNFVLQDFAGSGTTQGDALLLRPGVGGAPEIVARLALA